MSALLLLAAAAAAPEELTICADRPSKANGACTVPARHWQLEVSGPDWTRTEDDGVRSEVTSVGSTFVKLGLDDASDIELGITPYVRVSDSADGEHDHASGFGDLILRYKRNFTRPDANTQVGLIPFIKIPTASHRLGNGKLEGGVVVPMSVAAKGGVTFTIDPELDLIANDDGHGYHAAVMNLINAGFSPSSRVSLSAELWNELNFDPEGIVRLWSVDGSVAYLPSKRVQLDVGANFGLNPATPDVELYAGASILF